MSCLPEQCIGGGSTYSSEPHCVHSLQHGKYPKIKNNKNRNEMSDWFKVGVHPILSEILRVLRKG